MSHRTTRAFERAPTFYEQKMAAALLLSEALCKFCTGSCFSRGCNCRLEPVAIAINTAQGLRLPV